MNDVMDFITQFWPSWMRDLLRPVFGYMFAVAMPVGGIGMFISLGQMLRPPPDTAIDRASGQRLPGWRWVMRCLSFAAIGLLWVFIGYGGYRWGVG